MCFCIMISVTTNITAVPFCDLSKVINAWLTIAYASQKDKYSLGKQIKN